LYGKEEGGRGMRGEMRKYAVAPAFNVLSLGAIILGSFAFVAIGRRRIDLESISSRVARRVSPTGRLGLIKHGA